MNSNKYLPAACLLAAPLVVFCGCLGPGDGLPRRLARDTVPTDRSAEILGTYDSARFHPEDQPGLAEDLADGYGQSRGTSEFPQPVIAPPPHGQVELPGRPQRPWEGSPHTLPYPRTSVRMQDPVSPQVRDQQDVIRPGDRIAVTVAGHPEFGGEWAVTEDGMLDIPESGAFGIGRFSSEGFSRGIGRVAGISPAALARQIVAELRPYVKKRPRVTVEIHDRREG